MKSNPVTSEAHSVVLFFILIASVQATTTFVSYSGGGGFADVVTVDADSLQVSSGTLLSSHSNGQDLTFDQSRRLFGVLGGTVYEYDPISLTTLNSMTLGGALNGLAARNGVLYSYSGGGGSADLVTIDADSLQVVSGTLLSSHSNGQDLAFDQSGRLFGALGGTAYEYDPDSLTTLNSMTLGGALNGLAVNLNIPEPSSAAFILLAAAALAVHRQRSTEL